MKCCNCSREIPENSLYCNWCGKKQLREKEKKLKIPAPRQLPSGSWTVQLRREGVNVTEPTEEACRTKALAIRAGFIEQESKLPRQTLGELLDKYIERRLVRSPSTLRGYYGIRRNAFPAYMDKDIRSINWPQAIDAESKRVAKKTLHNEISLVAAAFKEFKIPFDPVDIGAIPKTVTPWLDYDQILVFVDLIRGTPVELPALLALHSLRRSEIFALRMEDIDRKSETIRVSGSTVYADDGSWIHREENKSALSQRVVPIVIPRLLELLQDHTGSMCPCNDNTRRRINRICAAHDLPEVGFQGLRSSFASLAYHLGWPEEETMRVGGWSNWKTVHDHYLRLSEKDLSRSAKKMRKFYSPPLVNPLVKKCQKTPKNAHSRSRSVLIFLFQKSRKPLKTLVFLASSIVFPNF